MGEMIWPFKVAFYYLPIIHESFVQIANMKPPLLFMKCATLLLMVGCDLSSRGPAEVQTRPVIESKPISREDNIEISFDTAHDERYAEFVSKAAGSMVRKIAVGIERRGIMRVELGKNTAPEDTLPLTKSLMAGARKDFPGKPITLKIYDPNGHAILSSHFHPDYGVRYEVAESDESDSKSTNADVDQSNDKVPDATHWQSAKSWSGSTEKDRNFAEWAFGSGHKYVRYIQADLERNNRLWFGVSSETKPDDVAALTKSMLEGARTEFPRRVLTAMVFDPEGEPIGNASLAANGQIFWTHAVSSK